MSQIYHVHLSYQERWVVDPDVGQVRRREAVMKPSGTHQIGVPAGMFDSTPEGATFDADATGTFDLPGDVASYFLKQEGWQEGPSPYVPEDAPEKVKSTRPRKQE